MTFRTFGLTEVPNSSYARRIGSQSALLAALIFQSTRANRRFNFLEHCGAFGVQTF